MKRFMNKKVAAVALAAGLILGGAGAAFAYFTTSGSGTGSSSVGSATAFTVAVSSVTTNALLPGSGSETLAYTITNASTGAQELTSEVLSIANSGTSGACLGSWFTAVNNGTTALPDDLAGGATVTGNITVTMQDAAVNQDACEGLTSVPVTLAAS